VQDEYGNGVPVAFSIATEENDDEVQRFLKGTASAVGGNFAFKHIMIDKSTTEISAIGGLDGEVKYLLCFFHMLQEWERFLRSSDSGGVKSDEDRAAILIDIAYMKKAGDEAVFAAAYERFKGTWASRFPAVVVNFDKNWLGDAEHWADFGRKGVLHLNQQTNNLLERCWQSIKYHCLGRKVCNTMHDLLEVLITQVMPSYMHDRLFKLAGRAPRAKDATAAKQLAERVLQLEGKVHAHEPSRGFAMVGCLGDEARVPHSTHVADLTCSCKGMSEAKYMSTPPCCHMHAAHKVCPLTHQMRLNGANYLEAQGWLVPLEGSDGVYTCRWFSMEAKQHHVNVEKYFCTCTDFSVNNICVHLMAADRLGLCSTWSRAAVVEYTPADTFAAQPIVPSRKLPGPLTEPLDDGTADELMGMLDGGNVLDGGDVLEAVPESRPVIDSQAAKANRLMHRFKRCLPRLDEEQLCGFVDQFEALVSEVEMTVGRCDVLPTRAAQAGKQDRHGCRGVLRT